MLYAMYTIGYLVATQLQGGAHVCTFIQSQYMCSAFIEVCYMLYAMYTIGYLVAHLYNRYMCSAFIEVCYMLYAMYSIGYLVATQLHVCTFIQSQYMCSAFMKDMLYALYVTHIMNSHNVRGLRVV